MKIDHFTFCQKALSENVKSLTSLPLLSVARGHPPPHCENTQVLREAITEDDDDDDVLQLQVCDIQNGFREKNSPCRVTRCTTVIAIYHHGWALPQLLNDAKYLMIMILECYYIHITSIDSFNNGLKFNDNHKGIKHGSAHGRKFSFVLQISNKQYIFHLETIIYSR